MKVVILLALLAGLGIAMDHRTSVAGSSREDRLRGSRVEIDMDALGGRETQSDIRQTYHQLRHKCMPETNPLGDHVCWAAVSEFNGIAARIVAFFFRDGRLSAVRVSFPAERQPEMFTLMEQRYGPARPLGQRTDKFGNNIIGWQRPHGFVATNDRLSGDEEALLLWLSVDSVTNTTFGIGRRD